MGNASPDVLFANQDAESFDWVVDQIGDAVCVSDKNMVFTGANRRFANFYGLTEPSDVIGKTAFEVYPDFEKSVFYEACKHTVETGQPTSRVGYSANLRKWIVLRSCQISPTRYAMVVHAIADNVGHSGVVALIDDLTSLPNRIAFGYDFVGIARHSDEQAVALIDISHFKQFNETLGFENGDRCLMEIAARLKQGISGADRAYRVGNDRFLILGANGISGLNKTIEQVRAKLDEPMRFGEKDVMLRFHTGLACSDTPAEGADALLQKAELALAQAKARKVESFQYQPGQASLYDPAQVKTLHDAMEQGQMVLFFQPQIDLIDNTVVGAEALVRWHHPERGILPPGAFLPLIEEADLAQTLDRVVLARAFETLGRWKGLGINIQVSVNLSGSSVVDPKTLDIVRDGLARTGVSPSMLCLEITEGSLIEDVETSQQVIEGLKALGVEIALDDFGTGYCSMSYLLRYPSHFLKIDRSFVQDLDLQPNKQVTTKNIIALAHGLGIAVVAEGVEREGELLTLRKMGCNLSQGYYHAKPMPEPDFMAWITSHQTSSFSSSIR
jgi:diguanylate cyclase (GGDEF)-like protein